MKSKTKGKSKRKANKEREKRENSVEKVKITRNKSDEPKRKAKTQKNENKNTAHTDTRTYKDNNEESKNEREKMAATKTGGKVLNVRITSGIKIQPMSPFKLAKFAESIAGGAVKMAKQRNGTIMIETMNATQTETAKMRTKFER
jgi:3-keto-L-gulonate-6-phosphate decarboxylase